MSSHHQNTVDIGFMGDVMIGRLVNDSIRRHGYAYPWGNLLPHLHSTDLNFINLETTFTTCEDAVLKTFNFKSDPDHVAVLHEARIDAVTIANNHIGDFGIQGMMDTIEVLDKAGIPHTGAGINAAEASRPVYISCNDLHIAFLGCTDNEPSWCAMDDYPGINYVEVGNINKIRAQIESIRHDADLVILSIHWGPNMRERPSKKFIEFAHQIIDAGVDIIHGHSAHIFQGIERYKEGLILYDTGDFIDDYMVDPILRNDHSFLFLCTAGAHKVYDLRLIPVVISDMQVNVAEGEDREWSEGRMKRMTNDK
ncbi:CapA family protein [Chitinophagaceae bacterium LB-8]|uniref:CapA family protein n=1 Tax=Paraflavisolibacter caeni TaxID=2982496 RepID=A0A9X2XYP1_9BACT|nr:CapA family protein [Paraflavisolibacter caeni]MCU7551230.1 CapA family protein [Paraflavisolibacter caeni]